MTTIAYDGRLIAWDGMATYGSEINGNAERKIVVAKKCIYALSGNYAIRAKLIEWHEAGAHWKMMPSFQGCSFTFMVIDANGGCIFTSECPLPSTFIPPFAIGNGSDYALGAMKFGATAPQAVEIAVQCDVYTGGAVQWLEVAKVLGKPKSPKLRNGHAPTARSRPSIASSRLLA